MKLNAGRGALAQQGSEMTLSDDDIHRYARQLILPKFDDDHQSIIASSHAAVIGAGGLGAPLLQYLAAAGVGHITIIDDDTVEMTNLNRQVIHQESSLGKSKAQSAKAAILGLNSTITVDVMETRFDAGSIDTLKGASILIDASDNPETRRAANRAAHHLGIPLVFGGAVRTEGQVASFRSGIDPNAPCYDCVFPSSAGTDLAPGCSEAGILGAITGIIGSAMALETIKQILHPHDVLGDRLDSKLWLYDGYSLMANVITLSKQDNCPTCGR